VRAGRSSRIVCVVGRTVSWPYDYSRVNHRVWRVCSIIHRSNFLLWLGLLRTVPLGRSYWPVRSRIAFCEGSRLFDEDERAVGMRGAVGRDAGLQTCARGGSRLRDSKRMPQNFANRLFVFERDHLYDVDCGTLQLEQWQGQTDKLSFDSFQTLSSPSMVGDTNSASSRGNGRQRGASPRLPAPHSDKPF
jgi:hypothetical protein